MIEMLDITLELEWKFFELENMFDKCKSFWGIGLIFL
jgi:hypothetical protein